MLMEQRRRMESVLHAEEQTFHMRWFIQISISSWVVTLATLPLMSRALPLSNYWEVHSDLCSSSEN